MSFLERLRYAFKILTGREIDCAPAMVNVELDQIDVSRCFRIDCRREPYAMRPMSGLPFQSNAFMAELAYHKKCLLREIEPLVTIEECQSYSGSHFREFKINLNLYKEKQPQQRGQRAGAAFAR